MLCSVFTSNAVFADDQPKIYPVAECKIDRDGKIPSDMVNPDDKITLSQGLDPSFYRFDLGSIVEVEVPLFGKFIPTELSVSGGSSTKFVLKLKDNPRVMAILQVAADPGHVDSSFDAVLAITDSRDDAVSMMKGLIYSLSCSAKGK